MVEEYSRTAQFRGARFSASDLNGATFRDSDLRDVTIVSCAVDGLRVSGFDGAAGPVVVDDVLVTEFVAAELDRRHPERVQLREVRTADDLRAMWSTLDELWAQTRARAEALPQEVRHERVDGEWSFVETLRHLVFGIDSWTGVMLRGDPTAYHRLGLPPTDFASEAAAHLGVDVDARPSYDEVAALHAARRDEVAGLLKTLTDDDLSEVRSGVLMPGEEAETVTVEYCLRVVLREHCEHRRYAVRDLGVLEARAAAPA